MRIEAYNSHVHDYANHLDRGQWKRYKLDGKYVLLDMPANARDIEDRLRTGCLFDDLVMENKLNVTAWAMTRNLTHR